MWLTKLLQFRREWGLSLVLALQATIMFAVGPLAATGYAKPAVFEAFRFSLAAAAVLLVTQSRAMAALIGVTLLASLPLSAIATPGGSVAVFLVRAAVTSLFDLAVGLAVASVAFGPGRVSVHRIMGGVILYLSIGLVFANAYRIALLSLHPSFAGVPPDPRAGLSAMLYFSLTTLTTTGYGDIVPVHPFVRAMANLEAVMGQLYPATLLARLVTLHAADGREDL
jgi:hypothetical protein